MALASFTRSRVVVLLGSVVREREPKCRALHSLMADLSTSSSRSWVSAPGSR